MLRQAIMKSIIYTGAIFGISNCFIEFKIFNILMATICIFALYIDAVVYFKDLKCKRTVLNVFLKILLLLMSYKGGLYLSNLAFGQIGCLILIIIILTTIFNKIYYTLDKEN